MTKELYRLIVKHKWTIYRVTPYIAAPSEHRRNLHYMVELESLNKMVDVDIYLYKQSRA